MKTIPLRTTASQQLNVLLTGQNCQISVYQKSTGLFMDLLVNDAPVVTTVVCLDRVAIVRDGYRGFVGELAIVDTQGTDDPIDTGLGSRFVLLYFEATDL